MRIDFKAIVLGCTEDTQSDIFIALDKQLREAGEDISCVCFTSPFPDGYEIVATRRTLTEPVEADEDEFLSPYIGDNGFVGFLPIG